MAHSTAVAAIAVLGFSFLFACALYPAESGRQRIVRIAELEIDSVQLQAYEAALKEEIETSVRVEPGVLSLSAVAVKGAPTQIRILEVYADDAAYRSHLETPHFQKYKRLTQNMVKSLKLIETDPIILGTKSN